jgi:hypothetical protein
MPGQSSLAQNVDPDTLASRVGDTLNVNNTYSTVFDNSTHDNSSHHHGDNRKSYFDVTIWANMGALSRRYLE